MAANINRVVLVGNLTRDPELRHTPSAAAILGSFGDVRQQCHLARPLDGGRHLDLVSPAGARDAAAPDLALLRDVAPELVDVLVVDLRDVLLAEEAVAPLDLTSGRAAALALLLLLTSLFRHDRS